MRQKIRKTEIINKTKWFFENIIKIHKMLARVTEEKNTEDTNN